MSTWEERMAVRTAAKSVVTGAEEFLADRDPREEEWAAWVIARGGFYPSVQLCSRPHAWMWTFPSPLPDAHVSHVVFSHAHYFHGNVLADAVTGRWIQGAIFSVALTDDMPPPPEFCPICADFKPEEWLTAPAAEEADRG